MNTCIFVRALLFTSISLSQKALANMENPPMSMYSSMAKRCLSFKGFTSNFRFLKKGF